MQGEREEAVSDPSADENGEAKSDARDTEKKKEVRGKENFFNL